MPVESQILRKDQILAALADVRQAILTVASHLPEHVQGLPFLGIWSAREMLAHLAGWDYTNVSAARDVMCGRVPAFYQYRDRDWQTYNAMLVKEYQRASFADLLALVRASHLQLLEFARTIPPEAFSRDYGVRFRGCKVTIQRLLEAETQDERVHLEQIREFDRSVRSVAYDIP